MLPPPAYGFGGTDGDDIYYGPIGGYNDIRGEGGNDFLAGGNISDSIFGGSGDDQIYAEAGNDSLYGETGNDILFAGDGSDSAEGGAGDDYIYGGRGNDILSGGSGRDAFIFAPGEGLDIVKDFRIYDDFMYFWSGNGANDSVQIYYDGSGALISFRINGQVQNAVYAENIARNSLIVLQDDNGIYVV